QHISKTIQRIRLQHAASLHVRYRLRRPKRRLHVLHRALKSHHLAASILRPASHRPQTQHQSRQNPRSSHAFPPFTQSNSTTPTTPGQPIWSAVAQPPLLSIRPHPKTLAKPHVNPSSPPCLLFAFIWSLIARRRVIKPHPHHIAPLHS